MPPDLIINDGIGPFLYDIPGITEVAYLPPTKTFSGEELEINIAGLKILLLIHTPGETKGEIVVWLPDKDLVVGADNYYKAFPNLYSIRGTSYRSPANWAASVEKIRRLQCAYLVPCHTRPVIGTAKINEVLSDYRDAIQYVHDQTIRQMNKGLTPDELVEVVKLPPHLANKSYLKEFYGTVKWSIRSIYDGLLGWFNANSTTLCPLNPKEKAVRMAELAGGEGVLLAKAQQALEQNDYQWVLDLTDQLLQLPSYRYQAAQLKSRALWYLGLQQGNANARNYYLTQSFEVAGLIKLPEFEGDESVALALEIETFLDIMATSLNPEKSADVYMAVQFNFTDLNELYTINIRRGVAIVEPYILDKVDLIVTCTSTVWKEIVGQYTPPLSKG